MGSRTADGDLRDAVTERYVDETYAGDDTEEALDEIDRAEAAANLAEEVGTGSDAIIFEVVPEERRRDGRVPPQRSARHAVTPQINH